MRDDRPNPESSAPDSPPPLYPSLALAPWLAIFIVFAQILVGLGVAAAAAAAVAVVYRDPDAAQRVLQDPSLMVYMLPVGTMTTLLMALAMAGLAHGRQLGRCIAWRGFSGQQVLWVLLLVCPLAILASEITNLASALLRPLEPEWVRAFRDTGGATFEGLAKAPFWFIFVSGCLLPGLGEEIFCRGFIGRGLIGRHGIVIGTCVTSFLFGAMHVEPVQATGAFFLGFALQFTYLATRSLWAPILLHIMNNMLAFGVLANAERIPIPGVTPSPGMEGAHTPWPLLAAAAAAVIALGTTLFFGRTRWVLPDGSVWNPGYVTAEIPSSALSARPVSAWPPVLLCVASGVTFMVFAAALLWAARWPAWLPQP